MITRIRCRQACVMLLFATAVSATSSNALLNRITVPVVGGICPISKRMTMSRSASQPSPVSSRPKNVLGTELECCCLSPRTGFYRDGFCQTGEQDIGRHTVCAIVTEEFLHFSNSRGNDLMTPNPAYGFPGLKAGDKWCLCALRWKEAFDAEKGGLRGVTPKVFLAATHANTLDYVSLDDLEQFRF